MLDLDTRKLEALERASAVERERTRIAQNIHDDVGASLTRISLLTQSAQNAAAGAPQQLLDRLGVHGQQTIEQAESIKPLALRLAEQQEGDHEGNPPASLEEAPHHGHSCAHDHAPHAGCTHHTHA